MKARPNDVRDHYDPTEAELVCRRIRDWQAHSPCDPPLDRALLSILHRFSVVQRAGEIYELGKLVGESAEVSARVAYGLVVDPQRAADLLGGHHGG